MTSNLTIFSATEWNELKLNEPNLTEYCVKQNKLKVTELNGTWLKDLVNSTENLSFELGEIRPQLKARSE